MESSIGVIRSNPIAIIAIAQLFGTSLWFSANSAAPDLMRAWGVGVSGIGLLTNAVQLGFILGTMTIALSGLADRFPASRIFVVSACCGAIFNACFAFFSNGLVSGAIFRFPGWVEPGRHLPNRHETGGKLGAESSRCCLSLSGGHAHARYRAAAGCPIHWRQMALAGSDSEFLWSCRRRRFADPSSWHRSSSRAAFSPSGYAHDRGSGCV